jgi:ribosomal protein L29
MDNRCLIFYEDLENYKEANQKYNELLEEKKKADFDLKIKKSLSTVSNPSQARV